MNLLNNLFDNFQTQNQRNLMHYCIFKDFDKNLNCY